MRPIAFLFLLLVGCGDVPSDALPVTMPNDPVSGIYLINDDGNHYGTFGSPSQGGHADGLTVRCAPGTGPSDPDSDFDIPRRFQLFNPVPNPSFGDTFSLYFHIACRTDVTIEVVEATPAPWILTSMPSNAFVAIGAGRRVWRMKRSDMPPGSYLVNVYFPDFRYGLIYAPDEPVNGFFRVTMTAGKFKAWRDVAVFENPCLMPKGLDFRCQR